MEVKYVQLPYWDVISREAVNVEQQVTRFSKIKFQIMIPGSQKNGYN